MYFKSCCDERDDNRLFDPGTKSRLTEREVRVGKAGVADARRILAEVKPVEVKQWKEMS